MGFTLFFEKNVRQPDGKTPKETLYGVRRAEAPITLNITDAELLAEGVPVKKLADVRRCLEQAVADTPALNVWPTLAEMARALKKQL